MIRQETMCMIVSDYALTSSVQVFISVVLKVSSSSSGGAELAYFRLMKAHDQTLLTFGERGRFLKTQIKLLTFQKALQGRQ